MRNMTDNTAKLDIVNVDVYTYSYMYKIWSDSVNLFLMILSGNKYVDGIRNDDITV